MMRQEPTPHPVASVARRLKAGNGEIVAPGEAYPTKDGAKRG